MSNIYNAKLRVKFLRTSTINDTPVIPGNLIIDINTGKLYLDMLASDNSVVRTNLSGGVTFCGTVPTYSALPNNASNGDMYNVADTGANYVWSRADNAWDKLSENVDLSNYYNKTEIDNSLNSLIDQLNGELL